MAFQLINYRALLISDAGGQNAAVDVEITVRRMSDNSVADLFSDADGTIGIDNPYITDSSGRHPDVIGYYVEPGYEYGIYSGAQLLSKVPAVFSGSYNDLTDKPTAANITYSNTASGLVATTTQSAIDEVLSIALIGALR